MRILQDLIQIPDGQAAGNPPSDPPAGDPPAGDPPAGDPPADQPGAGDRPEFIPEEAWTETGYDKAKHLELLRNETRPASADAYALPEIDGLDKDKVGSSPLVVALRNAAFEAGVDQGAFDKAFQTYAAESIRLSSEATENEQKALGENHKARTDAIGAWLGKNLAADEAQAVAAGLTSAKAVMAFEKLMSKGARTAGGDPPPPAARETRAEIEALMNTKAYMGKAHERDPAVIKKVDDWFKAEAAEKNKK